MNLNVSSHLARREDRVSAIIQRQKAHESKVHSHSPCSGGLVDAGWDGQVAEVQKRKLLSPRPEPASPSEAAVMAPRPAPTKLDDLPIPTLARKP